MSGIPKYRNTVEQTVNAKKANLNIVNRMFDGAGDEEKSSIQFNNIAVEDITPRSINKYRQNRIERLAKSIHNTGNRLIHPIVLVKGSDLPEDSEAYKKFMERGINPRDLKYIIVSGERRYRAWLLLREKDAERIKRDGGANRFDTITANVLTKNEALKENNFFEDSNLETRQLTSLEAILHIKSAIEEVETVDQKKEALKEMGKDPEKCKFNQADFCQYYLQNELGIENVSLGTIKHDLAILNNCDERIIDAVIEEIISPKMARELYSLPKPSQVELLNLFRKDGYAAFRTRLDSLKEDKKTPRTTRKNHKDAANTIRAIKKGIVKKKEELKLIAEDLGTTDRDFVKKAISAIDSMMEELDECFEKLN